MEVETKRSVADYFVVAGMPKENPQLLDDFSLEANLKPSAYQDPITDITVIIPALGENTPDHFEKVEFTPGGHARRLSRQLFSVPAGRAFAGPPCLLHRGRRCRSVPPVGVGSQAQHDPR